MVFGPKPVVVGHRGAPHVAPENTVAAFLAAADAGAAWVEVDVRRSRDAVPVVVHDDRLADGRAVVDLDAAQLAAVGIATLAEVLAALPPQLGVDLEVKNLPGHADYDEQHTVVAVLADVLRSGDVIGSRPLLVSSFNPLTVLAAGEQLGDVPRGLLGGDALRLSALVSIAQEVGAVVACPHVDAPRLDVELAEGVAAPGTVMVWTVDDPDRAVALARAGAAAICTNDPAGIVGALARPDG